MCTGILKCFYNEILHATVISGTPNSIEGNLGIQSIGLDYYDFKEAVEGGEMPLWTGIKAWVPNVSVVVKGVLLNGVDYTPDNNNKVALPVLMTNTYIENRSLSINLTTNIHIVTTDVTSEITITNIQFPPNISSVSHVYFNYVGGKPLQIKIDFAHQWEGGEDPSGTITDACYCELTIKKIVVNGVHWHLVSLKTYN